MSFVDRLDARQRRHPVLGFPIAVVYKFFDDQGVYLSALITYYGFLSLFPLLLLLTSVLGFALQNDAALRVRILNSTLRQFPGIGDQLTDPRSLKGSGLALVIGGLIAVYGALGVAHAIQNAMNVAWAVPKYRRPNPLRLRLRAMLLVAIGGLAALTTTVLSALASSANAFGAQLGPVTTLLVMVAAIAVNATLVIMAFRICTARATTVRDVLPGAITAAVIWQVLQLFGTAYVGRVVKNASLTYGTFALVFGLMAWIYLAAVGLVISAEINVVRAKHLYPRSLLTPFTDNVDLTRADRHAYSHSAEAQQAKGFESVKVTFDHDGQYATAMRLVDEENAALEAHRADAGRPSPARVADHGDPRAKGSKPPGSADLQDV